MQRITKWLLRDKHRYTDSRELADLLRRRDTGAIEFLMSKTENLIRKMVKESGLPESAVSELLHDGIIKLIEKISDGVYNPDLSAPPTYLIGICKFLLLNRREKAEAHPFSPFEPGMENLHLFETDIFRKEELEEIIETWLSRLGAPCSDLIRLKYLDGYSDQEQIEMKRTSYSSVNSLKVTRSKCMDKLIVIAEKWKKQHDAS